MKKRVISLSIIALFTVSMLSGCGLVKSVLKYEIKKTVSNSEIEEIKDTEDKVEAVIEEAEDEAPSNLYVDYADDVLDNYDQYDAFVATKSDYRTKIVFSTDGKIRNIELLKLSFDTEADDGTVVFSKENIYSQEELTKDRPLVVDIEFVGMLPNNGISYTDSNGEIVQLAVEESGYDGSLILTPFESVD